MIREIARRRLEELRKKRQLKVLRNQVESTARKLEDLTEQLRRERKCLVWLEREFFDES